MTDEKWQDAVGRVKDSFAVLEEKTEENPREGVERREWIVFTGPLGKMKLMRETKPRVLDKKTIGSRRIGGQTTVEYVYSPDEKVQKVFAYRFNEAKNDWEEMNDAGFV